MTATISHLPSHALTCWVDDAAIYAAIPSTNPLLPPYITKFPLTDGGLSKALNFLRQRYDEVPSAMKNYTAKGREPSTVNGKPPVQTNAQRDAALNVLRKMGLV